MMLVEETFVPSEALPVAAFREHLRLGSGFSDDGLQDSVIETYLRAALAAVEARTGKIVLRRQFSVSFHHWRNGMRQTLPVAPVSTITAVELIDRNGFVTQSNTDAWHLLPDSQMPQIVASGAALPSIPQGGQAKVTFEAGFGLNWTDAPADLAQAVILLASHYYEFRNDPKDTTSALPGGVSALLSRFKTMRLFMGGRR